MEFGRFTSNGLPRLESPDDMIIPLRVRESNETHGNVLIWLHFANFAEVPGVLCGQKVF
jgi:hypothetical protein